MAVKKNYSRRKKSFKKRSVTARRKASKRVTRIERPIAVLGRGFPKKMLITHKYTQTNVLSNTAGAINYQTFSANGMYDPDYSGVGHQPLYFDEMSNVYNHYCVIGSKITVRAAGTTSSGTGSNFTPVLIALQIHSAATPSQTSPIVLSEQNQAIVRLMGPSQGNAMVLTKKWSAKKFFGKSVLANDELKGTPSANPVEQSYFTVSTRPVDAVSTTSITLYVTIQYIAVWKELKTATPS